MQHAELPDSVARIKRRVVTGIIMIAAGVVVVTPVGAALSDLGGGSTNPSLEAVPVDASDPQADPSDENDSSNQPTLDSEQRALAAEALASDPRAQKLLAGRSYELGSIGPWTSDGPTGSLIGASMLVKLTPPATYPMSTWPVAEYEPSADPPYQEGTIELAAEHVEMLIVDVDLVDRRVISIQPFGEDVRVTPGSNPPRPAEPSPEEPGY